MRNFRNQLLIVSLCILASNAGAQTLEHLHLVSASRNTVGPYDDISVSPHGVVRAYGTPFVWDSTNRLWKRLDNPFLGDSLGLVATLISPSGVIFDQLSNGWITRSEDAGLNFTQLPDPSGNVLPDPLGTLMLSPAGELFIRARAGIVRSQDDGQTWDSIATPINFSVTYAFDKSGDLFSLGSRVYRLSRGMASFDSVGVLPFNAGSLITCSPDSNTLLVGGRFLDSNYLLMDNNQWKALPLPFPYQSGGSITSLSCDSASHIYAGSDGNLLRSNDTGRSWVAIDTGASEIVWTSFQTPSTLWYATQSHVLQYSLTSGALLPCDSPFETLDTWMVAAKGDTVYAGAEDDSAFFESTDDGNSWRQPLRDSNLAILAGSSVQFAPDGATYLSNGINQLLKSYGGMNWQNALPNGVEPPAPSLTIDSESNLYIFAHAQYYYESNDAGSTWQNRRSPAKPPAYPGLNSTGYLCGAVDSLFEFTMDDGQTWQYTTITDTSAHGYATVHSGFGRTWLSYDSVLMLSTDEGMTWARAMQGLTHSPLTYITTDPEGHTFCIQGNFFYGIPGTCSIYDWSPSKQRWAQLTPDTTLYVYSMCANSKYLFLGTQSGVFRVATADFKLDVPKRASLPEESAVAFPNPSSDGFSIHFYLDVPSWATITIYDVLGNGVETMDAGMCAAGWNTVPVTTSVPSGAYTYQIETSGPILRGRVAIISR